MKINTKTFYPKVEYYGSFAIAFRKKVHILIDWGYKGALLRIKNNSHDEPTITGYIAESVNHILYALDSPDWCNMFSIKEDSPVEAKGREGKSRFKPDLIIESTIKPRCEYIFEAKRLKKHNFEAAQYLGKDGLECFLDGRYAAGYDEAAMLGYIQNDSPQEWQTKLQNEIVKKKKPLALISPPEYFKVIEEFPEEWKTVHQREKIDRTISIFHILLDFRSEF